MADLRITGLAEEMSSLAQMPWSKQLEEWPEDPALAEKRGISRHIVRLVRASSDPDAEVYAVKETVAECALRPPLLPRTMYKASEYFKKYAAE